MDPYALIAQYPNAGQAFSDAFGKGMQQNALAGFAMNPGDPNAQGAAARYDPGAVMQYRQGQQSAQQQLSQEQHQTWIKWAANAAKAAKTPEQMRQTVDYLLSSGHGDLGPEATQALQQLKSMPDEQWPAVRAAYMAMGGQSDDAGAGQPKVIPLQPGGSVVQYDPTTGQIKPLVMPNDGSQTSGSPAPAPGGDLRSEAIKAIQAGADPAKVLQRMMQLQGGQAATPSATFPGPN
jgi:hypothetical protein